MIDYFDGCAWFGHGEFEFLKEPTQESLQAVMKSLYGDEEDA